ncbi:MAG: hypothetical protein V4692_13065, partial [Bdellovibrionota bacterium]
YDSSEGTANVFIQVTSPKEVAENPMNAPSPLAVAEGKTIVRGDQIRTVILEARPTSRFIVSKNGDNVMIEAVAKITEIKTK